MENKLRNEIGNILIDCEGHGEKDLIEQLETLINKHYVRKDEAEENYLNIKVIENPYLDENEMYAVTDITREDIARGEWAKHIVKVKDLKTNTENGGNDGE